MKKFRVILPVDIAGQVHEYGEVIGLDEETAAANANCLIPLEGEPEENGRNSEGL